MKQTTKYLLIIIGFLILIPLLNNPKPQTVVPDITSGGCFEKNDCWKPITKGYCNINYDCISGKCYNEDILCPENCGVIGDEDMDGLKDCDDSDCWNSVYCPCSNVNFGECAVNRCYCPQGAKPRWYVIEGGRNYCACT